MAILQRACRRWSLIDELAHTQTSRAAGFAKRYEDVLLLLENKIDVLSTINIQHVESLAPRVQALTGIHVREQVPDWVLDRADEIVISDLTPGGAGHAHAPRRYLSRWSAWSARFQTSSAAAT